jgi:putative DNA methylase
VADQSVDLILTDPPYFDNIAYSELSDFFLPWLQAFGMARARPGPAACLPTNLAARARGEEALLTFQRGLAQCFVQMRRVLKQDGRLVFSYQHRTPEAWAALAVALAAGGWRPVQVFPMLGNSTAGPHLHEGTITWDAVSAYSKGTVLPADALALSPATTEAAAQHVRAWSARLRRHPGVPFRAADRTNLWRACLVAAALGMFGGQGGAGQCPLREALAEEFTAS